MDATITEVMPTHILFTILCSLILASAFFSSSETAMMAINRYRLKHAAKTSGIARRVVQLLARPDRLLTIVLIGNTFANIAAASIATIIGVRASGESGGVIATIVLSIVVLLFAEIAPKIVASKKPEPIAYFAAIPLQWLIKLFFPIVWAANALSNGLLAMMGVKHHKKMLDILTLDELRTVVTESESLIPTRHQSMLTSILDLERITVDDIMIPRAEVVGININDDEADILAKIRTIQHTLIPIYHDNIDEIYGILHLRNLVGCFTEQRFSKEQLLQLSDKPYFVPEGTPLHTQLFNFQHNRNRLGLVVDEYGDILGLVTLADILEEIVGEFTTDITATNRIIPQPDGSYLVDGGTNIRMLNQTMQWDLPTVHAKTMSGAIIDHLEMIPTTNTCVLLNNYPIEIMKVQDNMIKTCKIGAKLIPETTE
jgi:Mg2+/Co2+ transporter CorB